MQIRWMLNKFKAIIVNGSNGNVSMQGSRKFCQRGSNFANVFFFFFLVYEGVEDPTVTINGPSLAFQRTDDGPTLNAGLVFQRFCTSIATTN